MNATRLFAASALIGALAGCGEPAADPGPDSPARTCDPVQIDHRFGTTRVAVAPDRIVPLSVRDQEVLAALGYTPLAVVDRHYRTPWVDRPWVPAVVGDPQVLAGTSPDYEQIARLDPALLLGFSSGLTDEEYRILSRMAPTVAQSGDHVDHGVPWQVLTRTVGRLLCRAEAADRMVDSLEARISELRARHPEFDGRTVVVGMPGGPEGAHWVYGADDSRIRFLEALGFRIAPRAAAVVSDRFVGTVSPERLDLLDADLLVWLVSAADREALESDPVYRSLDVVHDGRVLYLPSEGDEVAALTNTSPLNLGWLLDTLVPRIAAVLEEHE